MRKIIMLQGLPASGKSTWAKEQVDKGGGSVKRVNKDDLRAMLDNGKWSKSNEEFIKQVRDIIIRVSIGNDKTIIVDDTNLDPKHEVRIRELAKEGRAEVEVISFDCDVEECIKRDLKRPVSVGAEVIRRMYSQYLEPKIEKYIPDKTKKRAVIFDIDGTLAIMGDRSPYDWHKVGLDKINEAVREVLFLYSAHKVFIFSGRDACCRKETIEWLEDNDIFVDESELLMRPEGDIRKDSIVKKEMFDSIKDKYNIVAVYDDRKQVVDMWRSLGLQCFQVNEGNF